jgi:hypothetical protein
MSDWKNRGGETTASVQLPPMDLNREHIFELVTLEIQEGVTETYEGESKIVNKVKMIWKESGKDKDFHRVWLTFNEFYSEKSNLMKFLLSASGKVFVPNVRVSLGDFLTDKHQVRAMLKARFDKIKGTPNGYYDFIPASIKPAGLNTVFKESGTPVGKPDATLTNALLLAKGATSGTDAYFKLADAKCPPELIAVFVQADKLGQVKYPI